MKLNTLQGFGILLINGISLMYPRGPEETQMLELMWELVGESAQILASHLFSKIKSSVIWCVFAIYLKKEKFSLFCCHPEKQMDI